MRGSSRRSTPGSGRKEPPGSPFGYHTPLARVPGAAAAAASPSGAPPPGIQGRAAEGFLLLRAFQGQRKKRLKDIFDRIETDGTGHLSIGKLHTGMQRLHLPCDWIMAEGMFDFFLDLAGSDRGRDPPEITYPLFDEAVRLAISSAASVLNVSQNFVGAIDWYERGFDMKEWLEGLENRLRMSEVLHHLRVSHADYQDATIIALLERLDLPKTLFNILSVRVLMRHLKLDFEETNLETADAIRLACTEIYHQFRGFNFKETRDTIQALEDQVKEGEQVHRELELQNFRLQEELKLTKVKLANSHVKEQEWRSILRLVAHRRRLERREAALEKKAAFKALKESDDELHRALKEQQYARVELDAEQETAADLRRELAAVAKAESHYKQKYDEVKVLASMCRALYRKKASEVESIGGLRLADKHARVVRRCWRLAAAGGWMQSELVRLGSRIEKEMKQLRLAAAGGGGYVSPYHASPESAGRAVASPIREQRLRMENRVKVTHLWRLAAAGGWLQQRLQGSEADVAHLRRLADHYRQRANALARRITANLRAFPDLDSD